MTARFHQGEVRLQNQVLGEEQAQMHRDEIKHYIREFMPRQHMDFFEAANWLVAGTVGEKGFPWAHVLQTTGAHARSMKTYSDGKAFSLPKEMFLEDDVAADNIQERRKLGLLGLEMHTRRRNRVNASAFNDIDGDATDFLFKVDQSFGNCPKYIQSRRMVRVESRTPSRLTTAGLSAEGAAVLSAADTFFIATHNPGNTSTEQGVDVSHRGGTPGFIVVDAEAGTLRFPDYAGNRFFQTLGNIVVNPKVGLLVLDYSTGDVYQFTGTAKINLDDTSLHGSERSVSIRIEETAVTKDGLRFRYHSLEMSPFNPSGDTEGVSLRLAKVTKETHDVLTFNLKTEHPVSVAPGQYGSFIVEMPRMAKAVRAWTISSTHEGATTEFDVTIKAKRGGEVSPLMHFLYARGAGSMRLAGIEGSFTLPSHIPEGAAFVFVAAGSGITPVMSLLRALAKHPSKPAATLFYSVRSQDDVIFERKLKALTGSFLTLHISLTGAPAAGYHRGRITPAHITAHLPPTCHTAYICGPTAFAKSVESAFTSSRCGNIVTESFDY